MAVSDGQKVNAAVTNAAFLSRLQDSDTVAVVGLKNDDPASGGHVDNIQQAHNETFDAVGMAGINDATRKDYSSENVVANGDSHKVAIGKLDAEFNESTGHRHDGTAGNGAPISAGDLENINLLFAEFQTFSVTGASGSSVVVSSSFAGESANGSSLVEGVITSVPLNRCEIIDSTTGTYIEDAQGQRVFARLTYLDPVWTLSFYTNEAGTETAHSLTSTNILVLYRKVFNQLNRPTIPPNPMEFGTVDVTADVVDASATQRGVVNTTTQSFAGQKTFNDGIKTDSIDEETLDAGVTIETVLIKDGLVDGRDISTDATSFSNHIASTSNPHSVTAAQVGADPAGTAAAAISGHELAADPHPQYLTSTEGDNAYLKRSASDFSTFTEKVTPVNDDIVLIEDSADSFAKKKLKLTDLIGGAGGANTSLSNLTAPTAINQALLPSATLSLGSSLAPWNSTFNYNTKYQGLVSGIVTVGAPNTVSDYTVKWPASQASANQFLKNDGSGNMSWATPATNINYIADSDGTSLGSWAQYGLMEPVTFQDVGDTVTLNSHTLKSGDAISFVGITTTTGIFDSITYYVVNPTTNTFQVASTIGGSPLALTGNGTGSLLRAAPVNGTGGSVGFLFVASNDSSMRGTSNFLFTHGSANQMGQGISYLCNIDPSDRGKVIRFNFEYLITSGTYTDGALTVWFYNVTENQVIQGSPTSILNSSLIERYQSEVQVPVNCAQMRVIIHISKPQGELYTIRFDNFSFGPSEKVYGQQITDEIDFVPTGTWSANTTWTGKWKRIGNRMLIQARATLFGAPSGNFTVNLPSGYAIDTAKVIDTTASYGVIPGTATFKLGPGGYKGYILYSTSTSISVAYQSSNAGIGSLVTATAPASFVSGDFVDVVFEVPILGWSSSSQVVSSEETGRVVAAKASTITGTIANGGADVVVPLSTLNVNQGGWTLTTGLSANLVVLVAGTYKISTQIGYLAAATGVQSVGYKVNAGTAVILGVLSAPAQYNTIVGNDIVDLKAGDVIYMIARNTHSTSLTIDLAKLNIERLSGPSQVLASETVAASYYLSANFTSSTTIPINFDTKEFDTHNAVTLRNIGLGIEWKFTAPVSGIYEIEGYLNTSAATLYFVVHKNGVAFKPLGVGYLSTQAAAYPSVKVELLAGQYIDIRTNSGGSTVVGGAQNGTTTSYINITKV